MKPSERIQEIFERICKEKGLDPNAVGASGLYYIPAIINYLDEVAVENSSTK